MKISKTGNIKQDPINRLYSTEVRAEKTKHEYLKRKRNYRNKCSNESDEHLIKFHVQIEMML